MVPERELYEMERMERKEARAECEKDSRRGKT